MITPVSTPAVKVTLPVLDPEKAKKADEVKKVLQQTLDSMKQSKTNVNEQRKSMAAARVARLKDAIKALKQAPGMDPKAMAKMIARLAKELASAVKEYQAAGGSDTGVSGEAPSNVAPSTGGNDPAAEGAPSSIPVKTSDPVAAAGVKAYGQAQNVVSSNGSKKDNEDDAFIKDAKEVLEEMKSLIKQQRSRIKTTMASGLDPELKEVRETEKALANVEKILSKMATQNLSV